MVDVKNVAKWFIMRSRSKDDFLTNMQLQKILYYAQGYYLGCYGRPLFGEDIKAWDYGPVVPEVYQEYKSYGRNGIDKEYDCVDKEFTKEELRTMTIVFNKYGRYSGWTLKEMTHSEMPYQTTDLNDTISKKKMAEFFEDAMLSEEEENELAELKIQASKLPVKEFHREAYL